MKYQDFFKDENLVFSKDIIPIFHKDRNDIMVVMTTLVLP